MRDCDILWHSIESDFTGNAQYMYIDISLKIIH